MDALKRLFWLHREKQTEENTEYNPSEAPSSTETACDVKTTGPNASNLRCDPGPPALSAPKAGGPRHSRLTFSKEEGRLGWNVAIMSTSSVCSSFY